MNLIKCPNGHFYDAGANSDCPYCGVQSLDLEIEATQAHPDVSAEPMETDPLNMDFDVGKTVGMYQDASQDGANKHFEPVVGWLVCIEGSHKGEDYRLHSEKNFIGRENTNDVVLSDDKKISRKNHATISFNPKKNDFKIFPGDGRGIVYVNDEEVYSVTELKEYDVIEIGETKLAFIPFCGAKFNWKV